MGVLNVTPDSFSDGGRWSSHAAAIERGAEMMQEGAGIIDVGGESTRPGADEVTVEQEIHRIVPVIEALAKQTPIPISVDTSRPEVIRAACRAGASLVNDVRALALPQAIRAVAETDAAVCLMHMQGEPRTMQIDPRYEEVVADVMKFLRERIDRCVEAGIGTERILVDPGIGFGKSIEHNLALLAHLDRLRELRQPILVGISRKSFIGAITGRPVEQRLPGSLAFATAAALAGASIIRAHDVKETVDAVRVAAALAAQADSVSENKA